MERLTIGRLARLGGVNLVTVRYYERTGLLPKPPRTASGYRVFPEDAARRLRFIKHAQELGFSLREIGELLALRMRPATSRAEIRSRATAKIADPELRALLDAQRVLENEVAALRLRKDAMDPADYEKQSEKLLTELALKTRAIRERENKK